MTPDTPEGALALALLARIPDRAVPLAADGWRGVAWSRDDITMPGGGIAAAALGIGPEGPTFASHFVVLAGPEGLPGSPGRGGDWRPVSRTYSSLLRFLSLPPSGTGYGAPSHAVAEAEAFARAVPARTLLDLARLGIPDGSAVAWTAEAPDEAAALAFVEAHPWILTLALDAIGVRDVRPELAAGAPADEVAAALVAHPDTADGDIPDMAARLRGLAWRDTFALDPEGLAASVRACARLPRRIWPACAAGERPESDAQQAMLAFVHIARPLAAIARISGRPETDILGPAPDFARYAEALGARAGHDLYKADMCGEWASFAVAGPLAQVADMAAAFGEDILRPALLRLGGKAPRDVGGRRPLESIDPGGFKAAGLRILLGSKSLPALCELSARWHARVDAIARIVAATEGAEPPEARRVVPDLDLGDGVVATQLVGASELLDEGSPGIDASGVPGLDHCVASYAGDVSSGWTIILSVRRPRADGFERLSTAELRPDFGSGSVEVVQHRGRGNADPDPGVDAALESALEALAGRLDLRRPPDAPAHDPAPAIARPGKWEAVRDAWAFALPRPLRGAGPEAILAAAGIGGLAPTASTGHHHGVATATGIEAP